MSDNHIVNTLALPTGRGINRINQLATFTKDLLEIQKKVDFKLSSRGWCYQLEGFNVIDKSQFNRIEKIINECRKLGFLPLDFVAEEAKREFEKTFTPSKDTLEKHLAEHLKVPLRIWETYDRDYLEGEEYYIQMLVEKVDLVNLFTPITEQYYIPIANASGWSSIYQRGEMALRFKEAEEKGLKCVLLYCGDLDPFGEAISDFLQKNLEDLSLATGWHPTNLIINRFGLNYDFVITHKLSWIENLISGTGKKPNYKNPIVKRYIEKYGERKVEANAIVIIPEIARALCKNTIESYLGTDALERLAKKNKEIQEKFISLLTELEIQEPMWKAIRNLEMRKNG